jgi:uncharacterized membrane protein YfcA
MDSGLYVIVLGGFLAAVSNAAFSTGGAMIVLAVTSTVLPVSAIVPIHSTLLIGSTVSRAVAFRQHVNWRIAGPFLAGSIVAVAIGSRIYFELPTSFVGAAIAVLMLVAIWLPAVSWRPQLRHPWIVVGFLHSLLSTLFAYGALLHAIILHTSLERRAVVGTMAVALTGMSAFKIAGYALNGFDYRPYLALILITAVAAMFGTWVGKRINDRVSENAFRLVFRVLVTVTAIRLLYLNVANS